MSSSAWLDCKYRIVTHSDIIMMLTPRPKAIIKPHHARQTSASANLSLGEAPLVKARIEMIIDPVNTTVYLAKSDNINRFPRSVDLTDDQTGKATKMAR